MRRLTTLLVLVLLATMVAALPASATGKGSDTFKIHGRSDFQTEPGWDAELVRTGVGPVARLGSTTVTQEQHVTMDGVPLVEGATLFGEDGELLDPGTEIAVGGAVTFRAANGDELFATYQAQVVDAFVPVWAGYEDPAPVIFYVGALEFAGGTGRFAGASGEAMIVGAQCFTVGLGFFDLEGTITIAK
jgi:hypothetical protein